MTQELASDGKIPTEIPQPAPRKPRRSVHSPKQGPGSTRGKALANGRERLASRGDGEVIELDCGITVYPARGDGGRWRAVWQEDGERQQCEAASEDKLEKVRIRLEADAPNMAKPGAALIAHYLDLDRLPVRKRWSRKHAHSQRRLCALYAAPVIDGIDCQDIKIVHLQRIVNAAPTAGEGDRVRRMMSALVTAGIDAGYLVNSRLSKVHWQAGDRALPEPEISVAGESPQWVDPAEIPSAVDVGSLGQALAAGRRGGQHELMAGTAAYSGLRWGELIALTASQVDQATRVITVNRKAVEVAGHLFAEAPKNRKYRRTVCPRQTPAGYPLAERLAARIEQARAEQAAGTNPLGLLFPSPTGGGGGGVPDLVQVLPPFLVAGAEGQEQVRRREQRDGRGALGGEHCREPLHDTRRAARALAVPPRHWILILDTEAGPQRFTLIMRRGRLPSSIFSRAPRAAGAGTEEPCRMRDHNGPFLDDCLAYGGGPWIPGQDDPGSLRSAHDAERQGTRERAAGRRGARMRIRGPAASWLRGGGPAEVSFAAANGHNVLCRALSGVGRGGVGDGPPAAGA